MHVHANAYATDSLGDASTLGPRLHAVLDALLAFGGELALFEDSYPGRVFDDAMAWLLRNHDACVGQWRDHIGAFVIDRRNCHRPVLTVYKGGAVQPGKEA